MKPKQPKEILIFSLSILAYLFFLYGIIFAAIITISNKWEIADYSNFLNTSMMLIAGYLSINFGVVLGISINSKDSYYSIKSNWSLKSIFTNFTAQNAQICGCYIYLLALLISIVIFGVKKFDENSTEIVPIIITFSKTFIGVIAGAFGITLGLNSTQTEIK